MRCRCGGHAARVCASCGNDASGDRCRAHPAANVDTVRCVLCSRALCFFHFVLQPTSELSTTSTGKRVEVVRLRTKCFPGCEHAFKTPEWRPTA
jgi:hypothetical protein